MILQLASSYTESDPEILHLGLLGESSTLHGATGHGQRPAAPWMDRLQRAPALKGSLSAVTATVVGVVANLGLWFALHVLFERVFNFRAGPLRLQVPDALTVNLQAAVIAVIAAATIFALKWSIARTLIVAAMCGLLLSALAR
jgi:chromate transporter